MAPFVIFVGKNNTGKSYLASLVWAMSNLDWLFAGHSELFPGWFHEFLRGDVDEGKHLHIDENKATEITDLVNTFFEKSGPEFLSQIFAFNGFSNTAIKVRHTNFEPFYIAGLPQEAVPDRMIFSGFAFGDDIERPWFSLRLPTSRSSHGTYMAHRLFMDIVGAVLFGPQWRRFRFPIYIPAARTGLMLAMRAIIAQNFDVREGQPSQELPQPLMGFLRRLAFPVSGSREKDSPLDWLAEKVVHGSFESDQAEIPNFMFVPERSEMSVPLHAASSMITELAPLLLMAQSQIGFHSIIFEEPEAHLHLEAQREMARTIARLLAEGIFVTVTTHSDTFVQQINNLIRLHDHPKKAELLPKLGYEEKDTIDRNKVRAYEFLPTDGGTLVERLNLTVDGFVVESLNETLLSLARETVLLSEDADA